MKLVAVALWALMLTSCTGGCIRDVPDRPDGRTDGQSGTDGVTGVLGDLGQWMAWGGGLLALGASLAVVFAPPGLKGRALQAMIAGACMIGVGYTLAFVGDHEWLIIAGIIAAAIIGGWLGRYALERLLRLDLTGDGKLGDPACADSD